MSDYFVSRGHGFVATGIQAATRSWGNHAGWILPDGRTVEAQPKGARFGKVPRNAYVVTLPLEEWQRRLAATAASDLVGTRYSFRGVAALGLRQFGVDTTWIKRRIVDPDDLFCSQLVDLVADLAEFHLFEDGRTPGDVTPGDLLTVALDRGWPVRKVGSP